MHAGSYSDWSDYREPLILWGYHVINSESKMADQYNRILTIFQFGVFVPKAWPWHYQVRSDDHRQSGLAQSIISSYLVIINSKISFADNLHLCITTELNQAPVVQDNASWTKSWMTDFKYCTSNWGLFNFAYIAYVLSPSTL